MKILPCEKIAVYDRFFSHPKTVGIKQDLRFGPSFRSKTILFLKESKVRFYFANKIIVLNFNWFMGV